MSPANMNEAIDAMVPIALFTMIALIVIISRYFSSLERRKMADTVQLAIEKGQPLPPDVVQALTKSPRRERAPAGDLRRGVSLVAIALGLVVLGLVIGGGGRSLHPLIGVAAIPGFMGLALIAIHLLDKRGT